MAVRVRIAGCPVDVMSFNQVIAEVVLRIERRVPTHIAFINAFKVASCESNASLKAAVERADLLLPDGMPIVWASTLVGKSLPERVAGSDLMTAMLAECEHRGYRIFLLGARRDILLRTVEAIRRRYPTLVIAGCRDGYFSVDDEECLIREINGSNSDLLFVGMSTPRKELWIDRNLRRLTVPVCQGVGGSFDVIAGWTRRAPKWMQVSGFEWLYRVIQEPRRLAGRYAHAGWVITRLVAKDLFLVWKQRLFHVNPTEKFGIKP